MTDTDTCPVRRIVRDDRETLKALASARAAAFDIRHRSPRAVRVMEAIDELMIEIQFRIMTDRNAT